MNRNEMIEGIMRQAGISKANIARFYEGLVALAGRELTKNNRFVLPGLGVLQVRRRAARMARNPRTGAPVHVPAKKAVRFKAYSDLDELLNGPRKKAAPAPPSEPTPQLPMEQESPPEQAS